MLTEGGLIYGNDGLAFHPDPAKRRGKWAEGLSEAQIADIYAYLRTSLDLPHDAVGNNGGSTGPLQGLSYGYVSRRFPGKTWGWGTIAQTMDVRDAIGRFLDALRITTDTTYQATDGPVTGLDPLSVAVLRVQQPLAEEARKNYGGTVVAKARHIVDNWGDSYWKDSK